MNAGDPDALQISLSLRVRLHYHSSILGVRRQQGDG